ncbi:hypothetical protein E2C01_015205 [Portunus trituberculatus]|uniref:Uncharacterized protein n=1 Tax=Portunus trituberculatus TaxID=210409 RepID=A0A5B7DMJ1_PORTR|nr:hypothetical protein [Portunus trituberculatus]
MDNLTTKPKLYHSYKRNKKVGRPTNGPLKKTMVEREEQQPQVGTSGLQVVLPHTAGTLFNSKLTLPSSPRGRLVRLSDHGGQYSEVKAHNLIPSSAFSRRADSQQHSSLVPHFSTTSLPPLPTGRLPQEI